MDRSEVRRNSRHGFPCMFPIHSWSNSVRYSGTWKMQPSRSESPLLSSSPSPSKGHWLSRGSNVAAALPTADITEKLLGVMIFSIVDCGISACVDRGRILGKFHVTKLIMVLIMWFLRMVSSALILAFLVQFVSCSCNLQTGFTSAEMLGPEFYSWWWGKSGEFCKLKLLAYYSALSMSQNEL